MTFHEFKTWLDGFSAAINGAPTVEQWEAVRKKLAETEAVKITALKPVCRSPSIRDIPGVVEQFNFTCSNAEVS